MITAENFLKETGHAAIEIISKEFQKSYCGAYGNFASKPFELNWYKNIWWYVCDEFEIYYDAENKIMDYKVFDNKYKITGFYMSPNIQDVQLFRTAYAFGLSYNFEN